MNRSKLTAKEAQNVARWKIKPYNIGLQVPSHLDTQIPKKIVIRTPPKISRRGVSRPIITKGEQGCWGSHYARSCSYAALDSTKIFGGTGSWKSAIKIARTFSGHKKNFTGQHFWARGYYVPTVGKDERAVCKYIKTQEVEDLRLDQLDLFR